MKSKKMVNDRLYFSMDSLDKDKENQLVIKESGDQYLLESDEDAYLKSHAMVFSAIDMNVRCQDMMALMLTKMRESDWEVDPSSPPTYCWSLDELEKWFNVPSKQMFAFLNPLSKRMAGLVAGFETEDEKFKYTPLFNDISYQKGHLYMTPNHALKSRYLINVVEKGFSKVDHVIFRALTTNYSKRIFEMLCRFQGTFKLYPITVRKLQIFLGIIEPTGKVLKPTYAKERTFVTRLLKPAMQHIAQCEEAKSKLELIEHDGCLGFKVLKARDGLLKIEFNIKWKAGEIDKEKRTEVMKLIGETTSTYKAKVADGEYGLEELFMISDLLASIGESVEHIHNKIKETQNKIHEDQLQVAEKESNDFESKIFNDLLNL